MSEKLLLLSHSVSTVSLPKKQSPFVRNTLAGIGVFVVLVGAADVMTRVGAYAFGNNAGIVAFAPVSALDAFSSATSGAVEASSTAALVPQTIQIPSIGVKASVEQVGKKADGSMASPKSFDDVAWYALGSKPGEVGNAVFAGHVNNARTSSGVFEHLADVHLGDTVLVSDAAGKVLAYSVRDIEEYPTNSAPVNEIFSTTGPSQIVLITCQGEWVASDHSFDKRLVVYAQLLGQ